MDKKQAIDMIQSLKNKYPNAQKLDYDTLINPQSKDALFDNAEFLKSSIIKKENPLMPQFKNSFQLNGCSPSLKTYRTLQDNTKQDIIQLSMSAWSP